MKKICSWTQTYGNSRILNFQLLQYDTIGNYTRNKCEYIIFSFHNCPDNFYEESIAILKDLYPKNKLITIRFNGCTYLDCVKRIILKTVELGCDSILQIQDDQHAINSKENLNNLQVIDEILNVYKESKDMLHLHIFGNESLPKDKLQPVETKVADKVTFYKYDSRHFKNVNQYAWNDGTYIINVSLLNQLLNVKNIPTNVWQLELTLKYIYDNYEFYRWGTDKILFKASNLFGRNINRNISPEENIERFFGETDQWPEIKARFFSNVGNA